MQSSRRTVLPLLSPACILLQGLWCRHLWQDWSWLVAWEQREQCEQFERVSWEQRQSYGWEQREQCEQRERVWAWEAEVRSSCGSQRRGQHSSGAVRGGEGHFHTSNTAFRDRVHLGAGRGGRGR